MKKVDVILFHMFCCYTMSTRIIEVIRCSNMEEVDKLLLINNAVCIVSMICSFVSASMVLVLVFCSGRKSRVQQEPEPP
jgi:hypothetical protein